MNEQLVVKNFGPITDATVDFKRVTVFIGPTGGGKSTLAKLAAVFRNRNFFYRHSEKEAWAQVMNDFSRFGIDNYSKSETDVSWRSALLHCDVRGRDVSQTVSISPEQREAFEHSVAENLRGAIEDAGFPYDPDTAFTPKMGASLTRNSFASQLRYQRVISQHSADVSYLPADRAVAAFLTGNTFRLQNQQIGIVSSLTNFLSDYETAKEFLGSDKLSLPFLKARFYTLNNRAFVQVFTKNGVVETALADSASGLQSSAPLAVAVNHKAVLDDTFSFIIEEPELNLYPTAQQGLLNWLVEKCSIGENDLTITTHSPYILSHLNLLLYAYQVADKYPDRAEAVADLVPRESWINPKEFACYQVENGGVASLVNEDLGLIDDNGLDNFSGDAADAFDNLIRLSKSVALK